MLKEKFLPYAKQSINSFDIEEITKSFASDLITRGPKVEEFEENIASYCGADYAVAFNSGSSALMATTYAAQITPYDRVITSPNTFVASIGSAINQGATPVFVDIDPKTGNIHLDQLLLNLEEPSSQGKTIITPIHFAGVPVNMSKISSMIKQLNTVVIEDAAHAIGSCYSDGSKVGSCNWSDMTIFSFHPAKTITTGEGGMVLTNNIDYYRRLCHFRNNGIEREQKYLNQELTPWYYEVQALTGNYNFTDFQATLGLSQFSRLNKFVSKRKQIMKWYQHYLVNQKHVSLLHSYIREETAYHLCVVKVNFSALKISKKELMLKLRDKGIGTQVHYIPLYRHPAIKDIVGDIAEYFPNMEAYYEQALSLPLYYDLDEADVAHICKALKSIVGR